MNKIETEILGDISLDAPWPLVEAYARMPRWLPEDVNAGVDHLVATLERLGVPVTVHVAVSLSGDTVVRTMALAGNRDEVRRLTVERVLGLLLGRLREECP